VEIMSCHHYISHMLTHNHLFLFIHWFSGKGGRSSTAAAGKRRVAEARGERVEKQEC
jgi:hypothetical protein